VYTMLLTGLVTSGLLVEQGTTGASTQTPANADPSLSPYLSIVEAYRGATESAATPGAVAPGQLVDENVTDSSGTYSLQVQPIVLNGQVLNGEFQLQAFDHQTYSLTTWVVGSNGYRSSPIQQLPSAVAPINSPTPVAAGTSTASANVATKAVRANVVVDRTGSGRRVTAHLVSAISGTDCSIYGYAPTTELTGFGWLIAGSSEIWCSPNGAGGDVLYSQLYEFYNWTWLYLNQQLETTGSSGAPWYAFFSTDYEPCNGYGTTNWVYQTEANGSVFFSGTEYWGSTGGTSGTVSCDPIY